MKPWSAEAVLKAKNSAHGEVRIIILHGNPEDSRDIYGATFEDVVTNCHAALLRNFHVLEIDVEHKKEPTT